MTDPHTPAEPTTDAAAPAALVDAGTSASPGPTAGPSTSTSTTTSTAGRPPLPDRLSADPRSPHHVRGVFEHDIGIRLNGKERFDVEEYCVSGGWVKVPANKTLDRKGRPLLIQLKGAVEAFYR